MAKFRSNTKHVVESWLDDEKKGPRKKMAPKHKPGDRASEHATWMEPDKANATVSEVFQNQCRARLDEGGVEVLCNYRKNQILFERQEGVRERSPVVVGDRVLVERVGTTHGIVTGLARRKNFLIRPAPGREKGIVHVLMANVEGLMIVVSTKDPDFSPGLIDRFLIATQVGEVKPYLCVNKVDLWESPSEPWAFYESLGVQVIKVSAKRGIGMEELREILRDKTFALCGHSGVGKTSLIRTLVGKDVGKIGDVNTFTGKGKHTTTGARLIPTEFGALLIDTPGIKSLGLSGITDKNLKDYFPEFKNLPCNARDCLHMNEKDCEASGQLRYPSYCRIMESLIEEGTIASE